MDKSLAILWSVVEAGTADIAFPERVLVERTLFRFAEAAAARVGLVLTGFSEVERARIAALPGAATRDRLVVASAFRLREILALIASGDPYVDHGLDGVALLPRGRDAALHLFRQELERFVGHLHESS